MPSVATAPFFTGDDVIVVLVDALFGAVPLVVVNEPLLFTRLDDDTSDVGAAENDCDVVVAGQAMPNNQPTSFHQYH